MWPTFLIYFLRWYTEILMSLALSRYLIFIIENYLLSNMVTKILLEIILERWKNIPSRKFNHIEKKIDMQKNS